MRDGGIRALSEFYEEICDLLSAAGWREVARNYLSAELRPPH